MLFEGGVGRTNCTKSSGSPGLLWAAEEVRASQRLAAEREPVVHIRSRPREETREAAPKLTETAKILAFQVSGDREGFWRVFVAGQRGAIATNERERSRPDQTLAGASPSLRARRWELPGFDGCRSEDRGCGGAMGTATGGTGAGDGGGSHHFLKTLYDLRRAECVREMRLAAADHRQVPMAPCRD